MCACVCDCAGIWDVDIELAEFKLGIKIKEQEFLKELNHRIEIINDDDDDQKWYLTKFIKFQYGELSEDCRPHQAVIKRLKEFQLI